ncbi:hypothetical protein RIF29_27341 [Crotalaria pallida]|uniref:Uncharacterized protein n=1 Tax=Crotalaria pallida TaxID=3830 RepID=A0AAN9HYN5_CROPI
MAPLSFRYNPCFPCAQRAFNAPSPPSLSPISSLSLLCLPSLSANCNINTCNLHTGFGVNFLGNGSLGETDIIETINDMTVVEENKNVVL